MSDNAGQAIPTIEAITNSLFAVTEEVDKLGNTFLSMEARLLGTQVERVVKEQAMKEVEEAAKDPKPKESRGWIEDTLNMLMKINRKLNRLRETEVKRIYCALDLANADELGGGRPKSDRLDDSTSVQ